MESNYDTALNSGIPPAPGPKYDDVYECELCGSRNSIRVIDSMDYITLEADTECTKCHHKAYWAHGFYLKD